MLAFTTSHRWSPGLWNCRSRLSFPRLEFSDSHRLPSSDLCRHHTHRFGVRTRRCGTSVFALLTRPPSHLAHLRNGLEGEFASAIKARCEPFWVERLTTGTLTPPTVVTDRALGNILTGLQSIGVFAVAGNGMSHDTPPDEVRVVKDPCLTGVGRWNDIDQIDRRPREVSVSGQD